MGLGILEDKVLESVPGTTQYFQDSTIPHTTTNHSTKLKCDRSGPIPIILVPQPSDDPNDPLNWPLWKRDCIICVLSLISIFATSLGSILAANTLTLSLYYTRTFSSVAILTGYYLLGVGLGGIFFVPTARVYGKRHLYVIGSIVVTVSSVWAGFSGRNYTSMLWARIFQGIGSAPFESLVNASVGDLYFVHERGKRMALTNLSVFGGAFFTPIVVGKITDSLGWPWTFYFEAIFCGLCVPLVFFFVPETAYKRAAHLNIDYEEASEHGGSISDSRYHEEPATSGHGMTGHKFHDLANGHRGLQASDTKLASISQEEKPSCFTKKSYVTSLRLFNGRYTDESFWKLLFRPFPLFAHPAILWGCLIQGCMIGWTVFIGIILSAIFLTTLLDEVATGYAYTGAFLGAFIGFLIAGVSADWLAKLMTRRNKGVYEPEFRIPLVLPQLVLGIIGLFGFGVTTAAFANYSRYLPIFFFGCVVAGMVVGAIASSLYLVDAHRDIAIESFTCQLIFKNFFSFGLTFSAYDWVVKSGPYVVFMWIGAITVVVCFTSIPMYILGKRNRSYFHRHDILKSVGLR